MEEKKWWKNLSVFQIVSIALIFILVIVIIVQMGIMISLKNKIDDLNQKNDEITSQYYEDLDPTYLNSFQTNINQFQ